MTGDSPFVLPEIDYLSKDFASFRQLVLDHLTTRVPSWKETNEADIGNVIVDILTYTADYLSYYQDAVATESYLGTARRRPSIKRHTRLLDYILHEGCNARVWVYIGVSQDTMLPQGTPILSRVGELIGIPVLSPGSPSYNDALAQDVTIFETKYSSPLFATHNEIKLFVEEEQEAFLAAGSTGTILCDTGLKLKAGQVLLFEEVKGVATGDPLDADPTHRQVVRLTEVVLGRRGTTPVVIVKWRLEDALLFPFALATRSDDVYIADICVARGNMVLADHGHTIYYEPLPVVEENKDYHPHLLLPELTHCIPLEGDELPPVLSAKQALLQDPRAAMPALMLFKRDDIGSVVITADMALSLGQGTLSDDLEQTLYRGKGIALSDSTQVSGIYGAGWLVHDPASKQFLLLTGSEPGRLSISVLKRWALRWDLISSTPLINTCCVEMEESGRAYLRFCPEDLGAPPEAGTTFVATYRVGRGTRGNIRADILAHVVASDERIIQVRNPLEAQGGTNPQSLEEARLQAPFSFQAQQRCVTEADYAEITGRHPQVVKAAAQLRWTGSWYAMFVYVQRTANQVVDGAFKAEVARYLEDFRVTGYEVEIREPYYVALRIVLRVRLKPGYYTNIVRDTLLLTFSNGPTGFFYPGNFTFGQTVYSSQIIAAAMGVRGVAEAEVEQFQRLDVPESQSAPGEQMLIHPFEIVRLDNDARAPHNGLITLHIEGGL